MATELLQPGVSVIQEFRTVSPTIVTPTLVPCAVAPCFQVLEALVADATGNRVMNTDAVASVPAILTSGNPGPYSGLDGKTLVVTYNNGAPWEVAFSDPTAAGLDVGQVKDQIAAASPAPSGWGAYKLVDGSSEYLQLKSTAGGDGQELKVLNGTANSILGFNDNFVAYGVSKYRQDKLTVTQLNFPDPRGIIDEIDIDESSIRVFMNTGTTLREFKRTESFLRRKKEAAYTAPTAATFGAGFFNGKKFAFKKLPGGSTQEYTFASEPADLAALISAMNALVTDTDITFDQDSGATKVVAISATGYYEVVAPSADTCHDKIGFTDGDKAYTVEASDDGDGDSTTPFVVVDRENYGAVPGSAQMVGTADLSTAANNKVNTKTLEIQVDGGQLQEIAFVGDPIKGTSDYSSVAIDTQVLQMLVNGQLKQTTFSGTPTIDQAIAQINAAAGTPVCYKSDSGAGYLYSATGTRIVFVIHVAAYTDAVAPTIVDGGDVVLLDAGNALDDLGFATGADLYQVLAQADIISQINATLPGVASDGGGTNFLYLDSSEDGEESKIEVGIGTANTLLGLTNNNVERGAPFVPKAGDAFYAEGDFKGYIAVVSPGGDATKLKLDREISKTGGWRSMYIIAQNIPSSLPSDRPTPNLVVLSSGSIVIKHDFVRNTEGVPIDAAGELVISYKALRLDVTQRSSNPSLLTLEDTEDLDDALDPVNTDNPLALMLYFMLINATGIAVTGLGVDETSSNYPEGTPDGYSRAMSFLEAQEVYALAPGTQDETVHQLFMTHVTSVSDPDAKGERIVFINPVMPGEAVPSLVTSGTDGDSTGVTNEFDTKLADLAADVLAAGVDPTGTIDVEDGLYLKIASSNSKWNISQISGTKITARVAFAPGENDDGFYSGSNLPSTLISETFSIYVRGEELVDSNGDPDYAAIAQAYQDLGNAYDNRRVVLVAPEEVSAVVDSLEQRIKGYYLCAAIAGMVGQQPPQQGFTNFPITGFTGVYGSNDVFSARQMNVGAAGGTYWVVQNVAGGPLTCRHQLTTDLTSIETRELSITKVVDFCAKFMRSGLRNFIGKFNITQPFLDTLSTVVQGQLSFLTEAGVIIGGDLNNIVQDSTNPDTVLIDVTLDVPYPCNYIRLTLVI